MYIKRLLFNNVGPIQHLDYSFPFDAEGNPKPVVLVGLNGSGKSILLSHIVNALISAKQVIYDNSEVEKGKVYKYRSPSYIRSEAEYYFSKLQFESDLETVEWQLNMPRDSFETQLGCTPAHKEWNLIPDKEASLMWSNFRQKKREVEVLQNSNCLLYFPPNRFEEPAWLNYENLIARAKLSDIKHISGLSNRTIIQYSPLSSNKDWLLDVILDREVYERKTQKLPIAVAPGQSGNFNLFLGYSGPSSLLFTGIQEVLNLVLRSEGQIRFGVGPRKNRTISVMRDEKSWIPNIFQLSTGETQVLNLFLSLLRDFDLTDEGFQSIDRVRGIVLIDEIDAHLHCDLQKNIIPTLLKRFPKVQFIVTSHSPLFLLGLQQELSDDGFRILSMPEGQEIGPERFTEFQEAYHAFKQTCTYEADLKTAIEQAGRCVVFVEGEYDIRYLRKAAALLGREEVISNIELSDATGFGNLDKIWKNFDSRLCQVTPRKVLLLYDCDLSKQDAERGRVVKRVIPSIATNPIAKGIENLFPQITINAARASNPQFFDVTPAITRKVRGNDVDLPEVLEVNKDEKSNLCNWLCENGRPEDFIGFQSIFDLIMAALA